MIRRFHQAPRLSPILAALVVLLTATAWLVGSDLRRPLPTDEVISVRYYTWAGTTPEGEPNPIQRMSDLEDLRFAGLQHLGIGLYCSFGRWTEPNNHIVNSSLINFSLLAPVSTEVAIRSPALVGGLAFGMVVFWLCGPLLGWYRAAPLAVVAALWHPYGMQYSQTARGYTWMLALQGAQLACLFRVANSPRSVGWGVAAAVLATMTFMNVVSSAVYWVLPVYLTCFLAPVRWWSGREGTPAHRQLWLRNILLQVLAVGAVGMVFLMDRFPYVYSSSRQYGVGFSSLGELLSGVGSILAMLFPSAGWIAIGLFAITGLLLAVRNDRPVPAP